MLLHNQNQRKNHIINITRTFQMYFFSPFLSFNDKKQKYYNKRITIRDNGNFQFLNQEQWCSYTYR